MALINVKQMSARDIGGRVDRRGGSERQRRFMSREVLSRIEALYICTSIRSAPRRIMRYTIS